MLHRVRRFCEGALGLRALSLDNVRARAKVHVHGRLASPNTVQSPTSPVVAAVLTWALLKGLTRRNDNGERMVVYRLAEAHTLREELLIDTGAGMLLIPPCDLDLEYATPLTHNPQSLLAQPPEFMRRAMLTTHSEAEVLYNERYLSQGDQVALRAVVEPLASAAAGPYRGADRRADFAVVPAAERPRLRELWTAPAM